MLVNQIKSCDDDVLLYVQNIGVNNRVPQGSSLNILKSHK